MRDRAITCGVALGLACAAAAFFAFVSRDTGPCGRPESCPAPSAVSSHPYAGYGSALAAIALVAFGVAVVLAARRRTAG